MTARDPNCAPTQYRTWVVDNTPDLTAQYYTGYRGGSEPLVDITAYMIFDDSVIADFNLPLPLSWNTDAPEISPNYPVLQVLPEALEGSQFAVIDGYAYLFGGKITNHIYYAALGHPGEWIDTECILPTNLYGGSLAIIDGYIYIFGGNNGTNNGEGVLKNIFSAPVSDPTNWIDTGATLPQAVHYSCFGMYEGTLYLFGGREINNATNIIMTASASNPLEWTLSSSTLPAPVYGASFAQVNGNWMIMGGLNFTNTATSAIYTAPVTNPTHWIFDGYLPYATAFSSFVTIADRGYLIGSMVNTPTNFTTILQSNLAYPTIFVDTNQVIFGVITNSNVAVLSDRIWLFGGSGLNSIFTCYQKIRYNFYDPYVEAYGQITRVQFPLFDNLDNPYQALCFPYWKTDYTL